MPPGQVGFPHAGRPSKRAGLGLSLLLPLILLTAGDTPSPLMSPQGGYEGLVMDQGQIHPGFSH